MLCLGCILGDLIAAGRDAYLEPYGKLFFILRFVFLEWPLAVHPLCAPYGNGGGDCYLLDAGLLDSRFGKFP